MIVAVVIFYFCVFLRILWFSHHRISRIIFVPFVSSFVFVLNRRQRRKTQKLYMIVAIAIYYFCVFLRFLWFLLSSDFTDETTVRIEIKVNINSKSWLYQL